MPAPLLVDAVSAWYAAAARDLPWRRAGTPAWSVLVSEVMLQQTPVVRVLPTYQAWLDRWPTAAALAADEPGEAVRMWGRLGYPRRALRLHAAAAAVVARHGGQVPATLPELLALPGVGPYTARAVSAFAHGQRHAVIDTNVRRVLARAVEGVADAAVRTADLLVLEQLLPPGAEQAATASAALMELGALICTAREPRCGACPVSASCEWLRRGRPPLEQAVRRVQSYAGTDRQVRGLLLAVLRAATGPVDASALAAVWGEPVQRARALDTLIADGLVDLLADGRFGLPTGKGVPPGR